MSKLSRKFSRYFISTMPLFVTTIFLLAVMSSMLVTPVHAQALPTDYVKPALDAVDMDELKGYVQDLTNFESRFTGYPGCYAAADYIEEKFRSFDIENIERHQYNVVIPVDEGAYLELPAGERITLYPMFPNRVCPPQTPPGGLSGHFIYVGKGGLEELEMAAKKTGKDIEDSILLMDFNTQYHWVTAAKLGAKAVIFIEPEDTSMMEASMKFIEHVAWNFPRLYVKAEDGQKLIGLSEGTPTVTLVSNMKWRRVVAENIIAYLPGTEYPDQYVLLTAGYDSFSFIPSVAPGAREAVGMAMVLQLARYYAARPDSHKYTLVFIAFSGTDQGVIGSRWFVKDYVEGDWENWGSKIVLQMNFDINDANKFMMPAHVAGWTFDWREGTAPWVAGYEAWLRRTLIADVAEKLGRPELAADEVIDGTIVPKRISTAMIGAGGPGHGIIYEDYLGAPHRYENSEPLLALGGPGFSWTNLYAFSEHYYMPFDIPQNMRWENVEYKLEAIYPMVYATINVDLSELIGSWRPGPPGMYYPKWVDTVGEIKRYNVTSGWYDPLPNALIFYTRGGPSGTYGGSYVGLVSYQRLLPVYDMADEEGKVLLPGLMQSQRLGNYEPLEPYIVDESTGNVLYAPGFGAYWYPNTVIDIGDGNSYSNYGNAILNLKTQSFGVYTLFECGTIVLFDVGDVYTRSGPIDAEARIIVNDFVSHAPPEQWSWDIYMYSGHGMSVATAFVPPDQPVELITRTTYTRRNPMSLIVNASVDEPLGSGFTVPAGEQYMLIHTTLRAAEDLHNLNMERMKILKGRGVAPAGVVDTESIFEEAYTAIKDHDYLKVEALSNKLVVLERDNYVNLRTTTEDTIYAITFFGLTLIPFAIVAERLFVNTHGPKRVISTIISYLGPLVFFWLVHPGFALASNPFMVVIGFLVVVLIMPLLVVVFNIAASTIRLLQAKVLGVHWVEMPRFSVALLGFSTGVSHMRKRRLLTTLTLVSVIFVTMGTSMFTSMLSITALTVDRTGKPASYDGILVRHWDYSFGGFGDWGEASGQTVPQAGERLLNELKAKYGDKAILVPRAWTWIGYLIRGTYVADSEGNLVHTPVVAFLGLTPQEQEVTNPQASLTDERGESIWFTEEMADKPVAIISLKLAEAGNLNVGDMMWISGYGFKIVGIVDDEKFLQIYDLDDLWITPWDQRVPGFEGRVLPRETIIIPYETLINTFKGWIVSVAIKFRPEHATQDTIFNAARETFKETRIPLFIGLNGFVHTVSSKNVVTLFGWQHQMIPLVLAALVVLGLITSSIEQRKRDIYVLSTVGLSPFHVGFLFLSESVTYSIVGGIIGYLLGIVANILIGLTPWGVGFELNYASTTVVMTISTLMAVIIGVTIFPIYRASKLITPSLERRWRLPKPKGDQWEITLPFTLMEDIRADGVLAFIHELLMGHTVDDAETFRVRLPIQYGVQETPETLIRSLIFGSALAPYELGITQTANISDVKDKKAQRHSFLVRLERRSGPRGSWITFGRVFLDIVRKQTLLWGSITPKEREEYQRRFRTVLKEMKRVGGG